MSQRSLKHITLVLALLSVVSTFFCSACGGGSSGAITTVTTPAVIIPPAPAPGVSSLAPSTATAGTPAFTLTVNGSNFTSNSTVLWNGNARSTTFISSTQLQASISAPDIAVGASFNVTVTTPAPGGGTSSALAFLVNNPVPALTSLSPNSALAGGAAFTLTVNGSNFVPSSVVVFAAISKLTTFISSTQLQAAITAGDIANAGAAFVSVSSSAPGGGQTAALSLIVNNQVPILNSLSPSTVTAGGGAATITVNGANFVSTSIATIDGVGRPTLFVSSAQLKVTLVPSDTANGRVANIAVTNPFGGTSSTLSLSINNPAPSITTLNPPAVNTGNAGVVLSINGAGFVPSSSIEINASPHAAVVRSSSLITLVLSGADVSTVGTDTIAVINPAPGGGSASTPLAVARLVPGSVVITNITPGSAVVNAAGFTMLLSGSGFDPAAVVQFNGVPRVTTFVSPTQLQGEILPADLATVGAIGVTVVNPPANGGTSAPFSFLIGNSGGPNFSVVKINQASSDLVADPVRPFLYLSVKGNSSANPNTISPVDLSSATITNSQFAGSNPNKLAVSGGGEFLYAGIDGSGSVQRFILPALTKDISYSLPTNFFGQAVALSLDVAPGAPHTTAVAMGNTGVSPSAQAGVQVFDDAVGRTTIAPGGSSLYDTIQWGADAMSIYAENSDSTGFDFYTLAVTASGVSQTHDYGSDFSSFANHIHFDRGTGIVYAEDGHAIDPSTGQPVGRFNAAAPMVPDSSLNAAFFSTTNFSTTAAVFAYDLTHYTLVDSINIPGVSGNVVKIVRWGQNGLAFTTSGGQLFIVGGSFISNKQATFLPPPSGTLPPSPPTPGPQTPIISALIPSAVAAGGAAATVTITGANFISSSTANINGSPRGTNFISANQIQITLTASDVANVGTAAVTVSNGLANGGDSPPSSFFVGTNSGLATNGSGFAWTKIAQSANDLAYSPQADVIYISVPGNATTNGNTISVLDPATEQIVASQYAGSNPHVLSITSDGQFLYTGIDGASSVARFALPSLVPDIQYSLGTSGFLGPQFASDLQAAPGAPHTTAVALGQFAGFPNGTEVEIYDDAVQRGTVSQKSLSFLRWGIDSATLFGTDAFGATLDSFSVLSTGVFFNTSYFGVFPGRLEFDAGTNRVYAQNGSAIDASNGQQVGTFNANGLVAVDSTLNSAFYISNLGGAVTINSYDLTQFTLKGSVTIPNVTGNIRRFVRWGQNGLAFCTDSGNIYLVAGNFIH